MYSNHHHRFFHRRRQRGQATVEVAVALLAIAFVVIAILFFGGIGITSIKTLLNARQSAENQASATTDGHAGGADIGAWRYTAALYRELPRREELAIPFLAHDEPLGGAESLSTAARFRDASRSAAAERNYTFLSLEETPGVQWNSRLLDGTGLAAANLCADGGRLPDELIRYGSEEIYTLHRLPNARETRRRISAAGWFDFTGVDIAAWRSNRVAYPAFGPRR